jgi:hypothetical protein
MDLIFSYHFGFGLASAIHTVYNVNYLKKTDENKSAPGKKYGNVSVKNYIFRTYLTSFVLLTTYFVSKTWDGFLDEKKSFIILGLGAVNTIIAFMHPTVSGKIRKYSKENPSVRLFMNVISGLLVLILIAFAVFKFIKR